MSNMNKWLAVDLSHLIGLRAASAISSRSKREPTRKKERTGVTHGILFVDRDGHPTIVVFKVGKTRKVVFYWNDENQEWLLSNDTAIVEIFKNRRRSQSLSYTRCGGLPLRHGHISDTVIVTDRFLLERANLDIVQREFQRTVRGDGFYYRKYNTWRDSYISNSWADIEEAGEVMSGNKFKIWALGGFYLRHLHYGYYYGDGSFSVGISNSAIREDDTDSWLFMRGKSAKDWSSTTFYGQIYFDREGRPVALALKTPFCWFKICTWVFTYELGDIWEWSQSEWNPSHDLSSNPEGFRFKKSNINY